MPNFALISSILLIHVLAWLTPGPQFVLIIRNSLVYSRKTGFWTALGFSIGNLCHITLAVFGISLIIQSSPLAFTTIKFICASYLVYLGIKTLLVKTETQKTENTRQHNSVSTLQAIKMGFLTNILSIGAYLFYASIFSAVLSSTRSPLVIGTLAIAMPLNTFAIASILTTFFTHHKIKSGYAKFQSVINKCLGLALILFAIIVAFK